MKSLFENKFIRVWTFENSYKEKLAAIEFKVDDASRNDYRGFSVKKAAKVAKWLRKIAKKLEAL